MCTCGCWTCVGTPGARTVPALRAGWAGTELSGLCALEAEPFSTNSRPTSLYADNTGKQIFRASLPAHQTDSVWGCFRKCDGSRKFCLPCRTRVRGCSVWRWRRKQKQVTRRCNFPSFVHGQIWFLLEETKKNVPCTHPAFVCNWIIITPIALVEKAGGKMLLQSVLGNTELCLKVINAPTEVF